ncbi:MAG: hypothetical protein GXP08_04685 [Gammaproteobacteria bacterium]|nr:hypothetical protein [Gammaproteobacteria bacterium]
MNSDHRRMWLEKLTRSRHQLSMTYGIDNLRFETAYWYKDVDLFALEALYGVEFMQKIYFHIIALEASKLVSLNPQQFELGEFSRFHTPAFEKLWRTIIHKVWGQWRYQHNSPDYHGPAFNSQAKFVQTQPVTILSGETQVLTFCGGGKDSLVGMKLLERADVPYATFSYSNSIYGQSEHQHTLIDGLVQKSASTCQHQLRVYDSFVDAPVLQLYPEIEEIIAAETPTSLFAALPILLQHGYRYMVLAHERSANTGNLIWSETGEDINHQWGKSYEAERLLNQYIQSEFISNCAYFSILQPIYDTTIFNLLRKDQDLITETHSCNIKKPWCCQCPKCAYVWLNYMAYLDTEKVQQMFPDNLFDTQANQLWFYQMLGLGEHTPFECIGEIGETRLAFELCRRKGITGKAMSMYQQYFPHLDIAPIFERYLTVDMSQAGIPSAIADRIQPQLEEALEDSRQYIRGFLGKSSI